MAAWLIYTQERFPLLAYALIVGGFSLSGLTIAGTGFKVVPFATSFVGVMLFFALLRLMDERKDYDKDRVAHPERPLPRGVLQVARVEAVIRHGAWSMVGLGIVSAVLVNPVAGACYLLVTGYLWLMYREFFCGPLLEPRPVLYALTHQLVLLPLCYFCVLVADPGLLADPTPLYFSACVAGAFLGYEVCRKLDPQAHPILKTYLSVHGRGGTALLVLAAMTVAGLGAVALGVETLLLPLQALLLLSLGVIWIRPAAYKLPEKISGLTLLAHVYAVPVRALF